MRYVVELAGHRYDVELTFTAQGNVHAAVTGRTFAVDADPKTFPWLLDGHVVAPYLDGNVIDGATLHVCGRAVAVRVQDERVNGLAGLSQQTPLEDPVLRSPMPGRVVQIRVAPGDHVERGDAVLVIEAMKMENELRAPLAGTVEQIFVDVGATVEMSTPLLKIS